MEIAPPPVLGRICKAIYNSAVIPKLVQVVYPPIEAIHIRRPSEQAVITMADKCRIVNCRIEVWRSRRIRHGWIKCLKLCLKEKCGSNCLSPSRDTEAIELTTRYFIRPIIPTTLIGSSIVKIPVLLENETPSSVDHVCARYRCVSRTLHGRIV